MTRVPRLWKRPIKLHDCLHAPFILCLHVPLTSSIMAEKKCHSNNTGYDLSILRTYFVHLLAIRKQEAQQLNYYYPMNHYYYFPYESFTCACKGGNYPHMCFIHRCLSNLAFSFAERDLISSLCRTGLLPWLSTLISLPVSTSWSTVSFSPSSSAA